MKGEAMETCVICDTEYNPKIEDPNPFMLHDNDKNEDSAVLFCTYRDHTFKLCPNCTKAMICGIVLDRIGFGDLQFSLTTNMWNKIFEVKDGK